MKIVALLSVLLVLVPAVLCQDLDVPVTGQPPVEPTVEPPVDLEPPANGTKLAVVPNSIRCWRVCFGGEQVCGHSPYLGFKTFKNLCVYKREVCQGPYYYFVRNGPC